jgi:hypothetical protein
LLKSVYQNIIYWKPKKKKYVKSDEFKALFSSQENE